MTSLHEFINEAELSLPVIAVNDNLPARIIINKKSSTAASTINCRSLLHLMMMANGMK